MKISKAKERALMKEFGLDSSTTNMQEEVIVFWENPYREELMTDM
jgi:hypothetical protein